MSSSTFDRGLLRIRPLKERVHDLVISSISPLNASEAPDMCEKLHPVVQRMLSAKTHGRAVILMMGAHVIRSGVQNYVIDLMKRGYVSCLAMNGAGLIHDYEFALIGATTESVARYITEGQFGLWRETGQINDIINDGYPKGLGMGEAVGKAIFDGNSPYKDISLLAKGYELGIPVTVHVSIGCDIIHEHPNCDGAATGATSYRDFLRFTSVLGNLEGGVITNFGSSVMAPEIFLKALSMARNVAHQNGQVITHFATLVCDLHELPEDFGREPPRGSPAYYFRPWKTMLVRTVADGGESFYVKGRHAETIPALWSALNEAEKTLS